MALGAISHHLSWGISANRLGFKQFIAMLRTAFPDLVCSVEDEINQDAKCAAHWTIRGTNQGPFLGNPPTGKPIIAQGIIFMRIKNGQVVENWILLDQMGMLQQLGLVPPAHALSPT